MEEKERIITFNILGEDYKIRTDMDKDKVIHIANFVKKQIIETTKNVGYASQTKIAVLTAINIAMELFSEIDKGENREKRIAKASKKLKEVLLKK